MADGYLEKRYEEIFGKGAKKTVVKHTSIESLMEKNRSYRGYNQEFVVKLHLPFHGTEPEAFIIICSTVPENKFVDIDLGIASQSMLLKATEMGLNGIMIGAFNKAKITEAFNLPYEPLLILAIGKGKETIKLQPVDASEKLAYYRDVDGVQFVPKIRWEQLIIE